MSPGRQATEGWPWQPSDVAWRELLTIVRPDTLVRWHRGFVTALARSIGRTGQSTHRSKRSTVPISGATYDTDAVVTAHSALLKRRETLTKPGVGVFGRTSRQG